jgi:Tol biopolymer transport system component
MSILTLNVSIQIRRLKRSSLELRSGSAWWAGACLLGLVACGTGPEDVPPPLVDRVVFAGPAPTSANRPYALYSMASDGTDVRMILTADYPISDPAVSPDGMAIAYDELTPTALTELFVVRSDGANRRAIAPSPFFDSSPSWSPDGRRLIFLSGRAGSSDLWTASADGAQITRFTFDQAGSEGSPSWSPDGSLIAFGEYNPDSGPGIHVIGADGSGEHRVYSGSSGRPMWSPDGARLAISQNTYTASYDDLLVIAVATDIVDTVTRDANLDHDPVWSPDGHSLMFERDAGDGSPLCISTLDLATLGTQCLYKSSKVRSTLFWAF